jgi:hypothetical protein
MSNRRCGPPLRRKSFEDFALVVDGAPEGMSDAVDLYDGLVQMPAPMGQKPHSLGNPAADLGSEYRSEQVPSESHRLVADLDAPLV